MTTMYPPISELLPHQAPMLWLDEVLFRNGDEIHCALTIAQQVFVEDDQVEPVVSIEWMAQAVGALVGMWDRSKDLNPRPGYLIAIPEASFEVEAFQLGERLVIEAKRVWGDDELASFECLVRKDAQPLARAQLSVYRRALPGSHAHETSEGKA
jgi:predicted hotdog family 3-hydroxylacyl-ACP dehydratase